MSSESRGKILLTLQKTWTSPEKYSKFSVDILMLSSPSAGQSIYCIDNFLSHKGNSYRFLKTQSF